MPKIRITKKFRFEAAHALYGYDGKCKNIHGHNYNLFVTIIGVPESEISAIFPKTLVNPLGITVLYSNQKSNRSPRR